MKIYSFMLLAICLLASSATAQQSIILSGYTTRQWQMQDSLPDQTAQAFAQTADGSLWIGSKGGLLRYDGATFTSYNRENASALLERGVNCLLASRDGSLWIGTEGGGLIRARDRNFVNYPTKDGLTNSFVRAVYEDHAGTIWVGADQGLFKVVGSTITRVDGVNGIPSIFVRSIMEDRKGNVWVGGTALLEFTGGSFAKEYSLDRSLTGILITSMLTTRDGTLWVGTLLGLFRLEKAAKPPFVRVPGLSAQVAVLHEGLDGMLWVGSVGQGLYVYREHRLVHLPSPNLPSQTIQAILEDREKNIWLGTRAGILRLSKTPVSIVSFPGGADSEFETIYRDSDDSIWVAASKHLFRIQNGVAKPFVIPGSPHLRVRTLLRDRQGRLWIGTDGAGLVCLSGHHKLTFDTAQGLTNNFIRAIIQSRDGSMWAGTDGGLTHFGSKGTQSYDTGSGLAYFSITSLFEDRDDGIWVGTDRGLSHIVKGRIVRDATTQTLEDEQIWTIDQDKSGEIWFGTSNGLYGYMAGKVIHLTTSDGLATNAISQILQDIKGNVWLSGPNSVSRLDVKDLDSFARGALSHIHLNLYLNSYDMESASLYNGMQANGVITPDGDVWFPSNKGAVHISVDQIVPQISSPVVIDQVVADGQQVPFGQTVMLRPGNGRLEISYGAIRLRSQQGLRYRYKMEDFEPWNEAFSRQTAYYTQLPPGKYRFRVQAFEVDNPDAISEASIQFVQKPHFYSTWWFSVYCAGTVLAVFFLVYRMRLYQMKMRFHAVSEERARLAREMHDTVIQGCVGVSTLLEAALEVEATEETLRHQLLSYANEQVRSTIEEAREAVWDLRNHAELTTDAGSLCEDLVREFQSDCEIPIQCHISGVRFEFGESATHELMMILREALSNALVHGSPKKIDIYVRFSEDHLKIEVHDDGNGFDPSEAMSLEKHYGLVGIQERAKLLGGQVVIDSSRGRGTEIQISLPRRSREIERLAL